MNTQTPIAETNLPAPVITPVLALVNAALDEGDGLLERARAMAEPLLVGETFDGGENNWQHAQAMAGILAGIRCRRVARTTPRCTAVDPCFA